MCDNLALGVTVRIRPFQKHDKNKEIGVRVTGNPSTCNELTLGNNNEPKTYNFDRVFPPHTTQSELYQHCASPLINHVLEGKNACVFAFGCTGSGKTHSMIGREGGRQFSASSAASLRDAGMLPQAAAELFRKIAKLEGEDVDGTGCEFQVRCSFLEVFRELVFDLLDGDLEGRRRETQMACSLRETGSSDTNSARVFAEHATEQRVTSVEQLLQLVQKGSQARSTEATKIHAHSSRSHALLILTVERRWRDVTNSKLVRSLTSSFTLADLAGAESMSTAHGGRINRDGVSTNLGLLALARVVDALAKRSTSPLRRGTSPNAICVPYRDSTLTRLMQTCLSGNAITQILVCISPAAVDLGLTQQTLHFALQAQQVKMKNALQANKIVHEIDTNPMIGDFDDETTEWNRRTIWITVPGFGDVFARCLGDSNHPLVLYVHGSGSRNSSMVWNLCCEELNKLFADVTTNSSNEFVLPSGLFHVAIDCPGYGRSNPGDRQTIRSYPGDFLCHVITALGRRSVVCICGSSQGAASIFNFTLQYPEMVHSLAVIHPVGHAPERYTMIKQPILLIFDTEDAGHPVSVGRLMRKYLESGRRDSKDANPVIYHEFTMSKDGNWDTIFTPLELFNMILGHWAVLSKRRLGGKRDTKLPDLTRVAGGYLSWSRQHNKEYLPWYGVCEEDGKGGYKILDHHETKNVSVGNLNFNDEGLDQAIADGNETKIDHLSKKIRSRTENLFDGEEIYEDIEEKKERVKNEDTLKLSKEHTQVDCDLCGKYLLIGKWMRLVKCRCALCGVCVEKTVTYIKECPVCGDIFQTKGTKPAAADDPRRGNITYNNVGNSDSSSGSFSQKDIDDQKQECEMYVKMRENALLRVIIEFGNSASVGVSKTTYNTWIREVYREGSACRSSKSRSNSTNSARCQDTAKVTLQIAKVDFNINPGYSKPTKTILTPDHNKRWAFAYTMGRAFPCHIKIHFVDRVSGVKFPKLVLPYIVSDKKLFTRRLVVEVPRGNPKKHYNEFCITIMEQQKIISNFWLWNFGSANDKKMIVEVVPPENVHYN